MCKYCPMEEANAVNLNVKNFDEWQERMEYAESLLDDVLECHKCGYYGGICKDYKTSFYEPCEDYEEY